MPTTIDKIKDSNNSTKDDIKKMLEEQREILLQIHEQANKTRRYILFGKIISVIYIIIIIAPVIFAIIYLPPFIGKMMSPYQQLLNQGDSTGLDADSIGDILKQFQR